MAEDIDIDIQDVAKSFGGVPAVSGISLSIARGEFFALLGPSGCGKTTLLRMLSGFEHPTSGEISLRGKLANGLSPEARPTNLIFQNLALFPHMTVGENVGFGLRMSGVNQRDAAPRILAALQLVRLEGFAQRAINQISGGQKQRVAIARALVNDPQVLLLDEPLSSLDLKLRQQMQLELKALQARLGTTFVYVTHDQGEAMTMADRIAVMNQGRIEQIGSPQEVYLWPKTHFVASFIGESNLFATQGRRALPDGSSEVDVDGLGNVRVANSTRGEFLLVRPEFIKIGAEAESCPNRFPCTVVQRIFQGVSTRLELKLPSGRPIIADIRASDATNAAPDQTVMGWAAEHCVLVAL